MLVVLVVLLTGTVIYFSTFKENKPLVFRYHGNGIEALKNYEAVSGVTGNEDIKIFMMHFINDFNIMDSFKFEDSLPRAMNIMSEALRNYYDREVLTDSFLKQLKLANYKTQTVILDSDPPEKQGDLFVGAVSFERTLINLEDKPVKKIIVRGEYVIKPLKARTLDNPYGLVLTQYKEFRLN